MPKKVVIKSVKAPGLKVKSTEVKNDVLIITYSDGSVEETAL